MISLIFPDNDNSVEIEAFETQEYANVKVRDYVWPFKIYTYRITSFTDPYGNEISKSKLTGRNFVAFINYDLVICTNDDGYEFTSKDGFSKYSEMLMHYYVDYLANHGFKLHDLNCGRLGDTVLNIEWHRAKENTFSIRNAEGNAVKKFLSPDGTTKFANLVINWTGEVTKFNMLNQIFDELYNTEICQYVYSIADQMGAEDLIASLSIRDPNEQDWTRFNDPNGPRPAHSAGVFGTSYKTGWKDTKGYHLDINTNLKSALAFSPFIFYMTKEEAKNLIVHELVHVKIGVEHRHDSYFWWLYEHYSGESREDDVSYNKDQELEDNQIYNQRFTPSVEEIIDQQTRFEYCFNPVK